MVLNGFLVAIVRWIAVFATLYGQRLQASQNFTVDECFKNLLLRTQDCSNQNVFYGTMVGGKLGIGVEYTVRLMTRLLYAVMNNQRFVFVDMKRKWEYNCVSGSGWACYFSFGCFDSVVTSAQVDLTRRGSAADPCIAGAANNPVLCKGSIFEKRIINEYIEMKHEVVLSNLQTLYNELIKTGQMDGYQCDLQSSSLVNISTIVGSHLFQLNTGTRRLIYDAIKERYPTLTYPSRKKYVALQIRLTDKKKEVHKSVWEWMNNVSNIVNYITPLLQPPQSIATPLFQSSDKTIGRYKQEDTSFLYIATDNCAFTQLMVPLLPPHVSVHSRCLSLTKNPKDTDYILQRPTLIIPGLQNHAQILDVLVDIEMLRQGDIFVGLDESNFVRMIRFIRGYPHGVNSFHRLPHLVYSGKGRASREDRRAM